jgi:hypothetical protein
LNKKATFALFLKKNAEKTTLKLIFSIYKKINMPKNLDLWGGGSNTFTATTF